MRLRSKDPKFRSERCGLQTIEFLNYYNDGSNVWTTKSTGTRTEKLKVACKIACPGTDTSATSHVWSSRLEALEEARSLVAKLGCGACPFFGKTQTEVDYIIATRSRAIAERLQAETEELRAKAAFLSAKAEVDAITARITLQS